MGVEVEGPVTGCGSRHADGRSRYNEIAFRYPQFLTGSVNFLACTMGARVARTGGTGVRAGLGEGRSVPEWTPVIAVGCCCFCAVLPAYYLL